MDSILKASWEEKKSKVQRGKDFEKLGNNSRGKTFPEGRNLREATGSDEHPAEGNWNHAVGVFRSGPQLLKGAA